jgi:hypothetical protein
MSRAPRRALAALAALALLASACSSDSPSGPASSQPLDVARLLTEMTLPSVADVGASFMADLPFPPLLPAGASCPYDATARGFVCPAVTVSGLTARLTYTLLDAAGSPLSRADRATTAAVRTVTTVAGTTDLAALGGVPGAPGPAPGGTLTVAQRQELTLSGLLTGRRVLDGTATGTIEGSLSAGNLSTPLRMTMTQTIAGVVLPAESATAQWPTAGTITLDATVSFGPGAASTMRTRMTFDGSSTVAFTVTVDGTTQRCTLNMARPRELPVCTG